MGVLYTAGLEGRDGQRREFRVVGTPNHPGRLSYALANTHLVISGIYNTIGKWVDPPATPDKVLMALGKG